MAKFIINGGKPLKGTVKVSGNKNAILPILAATLLTDQDCFLTNVPKITDVEIMAQILVDLGAKIQKGDHGLLVNTKSVKKQELNPNLVAKLRASILLLGPLLARFGKAQMRHPGGCIIGPRAVGTHFDVLAALGASVVTGEEDYKASVKKLHPAEIFLDEASVTATENALMTACLIPGRTVIDDAACEPHVEDLANFLNKMGAKISGGGTNRIMIEGVKRLGGASHDICPDYMDVGTFLIIGAATGGHLKITHIDPAALKMIFLYLQRMGVKLRAKDNVVEVFPSLLKAPTGKIQTRPWPGFPTDLMSPLIVLATQCQGTTLCHDWMFESRMFFIDKLITMGANITLCDPHRVLVSGPTKLRGKELESPDIRAGMAMVVAALAAKGESVIKNVEMIERGYEEVQKRLKLLGADITRVA